MSSYDCPHQVALRDALIRKDAEIKALKDYTKERDRQIAAWQRETGCESASTAAHKIYQLERVTDLGKIAYDIRHWEVEGDDDAVSVLIRQILVIIADFVDTHFGFGSFHAIDRMRDLLEKWAIDPRDWQDATGRPTPDAAKEKIRKMERKFRQVQKALDL